MQAYLELGIPWTIGRDYDFVEDSTNKKVAGRQSVSGSHAERSTKWSAWCRDKTTCAMAMRMVGTDLVLAMVSQLGKDRTGMRASPALSGADVFERPVVCPNFLGPLLFLPGSRK